MGIHIGSNDPPAKPDFDVYPENWQSWLIWQDVKNQWRVHMGGLLSLDGNFVLAWIQLTTRKPSEIQQLYRDVQYIAHGYLTATEERNKKSDG